MIKSKQPKIKNCHNCKVFDTCKERLDMKETYDTILDKFYMKWLKDECFFGAWIWDKE